MMIRIFFTSLLITLGACASNSNNGLKDKTPAERRAELYYSHGTSMLMQKEYTEALDNLIKAAELAPRDSKIHNNLGMAYYFKKDINLATTHLKRAISLDSKNSDARNNLASIYYQQNNLKLAEEQYREVEKDLLYRTQYRTYYNLALIYIKRNEIVDAVELLKKSISNKDDYCPANYQLAVLEKNRFAYKEALKWFRNAQKGVCVSDPLPHYQEAITLLDLKNDEAAIEKFNYIIDTFSTSRYAPLAQNQLRKLNNSENQKFIEAQALKRRFEKVQEQNSNPTYSSPEF